MKDTNTIRYGKFSITPSRELQGELRLAGEETQLSLHDTEEIQTNSILDNCITGTLHDRTRVTLMKCVTINRSNSGSVNGERYYSAKLFPHFVVEGHQHIAPNDGIIRELSFMIEDATALFYDFDAFGTFLDAAPYIDQLVTAQAKKANRTILTGPQPIISYFTGKHDIIEIDTVLGKFRAKHNPLFGLGDLGGPRGVRINNIISVSLETENRIAFNEAMNRAFKLLRFLEVIIGRPQKVQDLVVFVGDGERPEPLRVHMSYSPALTANSTQDSLSPQPADLLLDPINRSEEFARVMSGWLENDEARMAARSRFYRSFAHQRSYSVERLIGAANVFDLLPTGAVPKDVDLPDDLQEAKQNCRIIFEALPESYERDSILNALGRIGKASLKHKTRHRARYIIDAMGDRFPDLALVLDEAINCRNHYVHGSSSKIDYSRNFDVVIFFTDTLEFVFGAAELIEAGWDIRTFIERGTTMTHPFGTYRVNYSENLRQLKLLLRKP